MHLSCLSAPRANRAAPKMSPTEGSGCRPAALPDGPRSRVGGGGGGHCGGRDVSRREGGARRTAFPGGPSLRGRRGLWPSQHQVTWVAPSRRRLAHFSRGTASRRPCCSRASEGVMWPRAPSLACPAQNGGDAERGEPGGAAGSVRAPPVRPRGSRGAATRSASFFPLPPTRPRPVPGPRRGASALTPCDLRTSCVPTSQFQGKAVVCFSKRSSPAKLRARRIRAHTRSDPGVEEARPPVMGLGVGSGRPAEGPAGPPPPLPPRRLRAGRVSPRRGKARKPPRVGRVF